MTDEPRVTVLPPAGPPPEGECDHCGCRVRDYGNGWEYFEDDERLQHYDGGLDCDAAPGGHIYHEIDGRERA